MEESHKISLNYFLSLNTKCPENSSLYYSLWSLRVIFVYIKQTSPTCYSALFGTILKCKKNRIKEGHQCCWSCSVTVPWMGGHCRPLSCICVRVLIYLKSSDIPRDRQPFSLLWRGSLSNSQLTLAVSLMCFLPQTSFFSMLRHTKDS